MEIALHVGAHRTGTTTFQQYVFDNIDVLKNNNVTYWGANFLRGGFFDGVWGMNTPLTALHESRLNAEKRIRLKLEQAIANGRIALLVSEENILGDMGTNIHSAELYPSAGERIRILAYFIGLQITRIVITVRRQDHYWNSAISYMVGKKGRVPSQRIRANIADNPRGWRHVIADIARAVPDAEICVLVFEDTHADPRQVLCAGLNRDLPTRDTFGWANRSLDLTGLREKLVERDQDPSQLPNSDGAWQPFTADQISALTQHYDKDLNWLTQGADGLATLITNKEQSGKMNKPQPLLTRGQDYDEETGLGRAG